MQTARRRNWGDRSLRKTIGVRRQTINVKVLSVIPMYRRISRKDYSIEAVLLIAGLLMSYNLRFIFQPYPVRNILLSLSGILLVWLSVYLIKNKLVIDFDDQCVHIKRGKHSIVLLLLSSL